MNTNDTYTPDTNGLYDKYTVARKDGSPVEGPTFTLKPQDPHARVAMMAYAQSVEKTNPALAADLRKLVREHDEYGSAEGRWQSSMELEAVGEAYDSAHENAWAQFTKDPIAVSDGDGNIIAYVKNEYEPGTPAVRYLPNGDPGYPGDPGYNYWRFLSVKEIAALKSGDTE